MSAPYEEHIDGVPWDEAPLPRWLHRCKVQTIRHPGLMSTVDRCACGAYRVGDGRWQLKNARRRGKV